MKIRITFSALWAILVIGLAVSYGGFRLTFFLEEHGVRLDQQRTTDLVADALSKRIDLNIHSLVGIRGLFLASQKVDSGEFDVFTRGYLEMNTDIQALEWIPKVINEERQRFEQQARQDGLTAFTIRERDHNGDLVPAKNRELYYPVHYVQPLAANERALGFDVASSSQRKKALLAAIDSAKPVATASINLVQDAAAQKGFVVFYPVFRKFESDKAAQNESTLLGFALGVFRIKSMFDLVLAQMNQEIQGLTLSLQDVTDSSDIHLLYGTKLAPDSTWLSQKKIHVAGRIWRLTTEAGKPYIEAKTNLLPYGVLVGGILLSLVLMLYLANLKQLNMQVSELVGKRTRELEESEKRSQLIVNEAADTVITIDHKGNITSFNPAAERMFGYTSTEVIGRNVNLLMPEPYAAEHDEYLKNYIGTGKRKIIGIGREVVGQRKDGSSLPVHLSVGEGDLNGKPIFVGVLSDMTQRKQAEQSLIEAKEMAEEANKQKSIFLNMMSHELRTPLTVILGYLPILKSKDSMPPPEVIEQIVSDMDLSGQHLLDLINDLLDLSKIEAGQMQLHLEQIDAFDVVETILQKFSHQAQQKGIELSMDVEKFLLCVDTKRFKQIMINLIGNALKFTKFGEIHIHGILQDNMAVFEVRDTGLGISADSLPFIFDAFKQADSTSTREAGGTGLGLAITKRMVELHEGNISVESEPGKGSVFRFTIKQ